MSQFFDTTSGAFRFYYARALLHLSNLNESFLAYVKELVDNAIDASARDIWLVVEKGQITIIDEGHGMVPYMLPVDGTLLTDYIRSLGNQHELPSADIREVVSIVSRRSLEWMAYMTAFSGKLPTLGSRIRGVRGVGVQGFRQFGTAQWLTKPDEKLAAAYYKGGDRRMIKNPPAYSLTLPTLADLKANRIEPSITEFSDPLITPDGPLEHGTIVIISTLKTEIESLIKPTELLAYLAGKCGEDVRNGVRISVVDKVTLEGLAKGGQILNVPQARYRGKLIYDKIHYLRGGRGQFRLGPIHYDPAARNRYPVYLRQGATIQPITALREFQRAPIDSGKLEGPIEYPELSESEAPWDVSKRVPQDGPVRNQWQHAIWSAMPEIEAAMREVDEEDRHQRQDQSVRQVKEAAMAAMRELDYFHDLKLAGISTARTRGTTNPALKEERVLVTVTDINTKQGVSGVTIQLWQARRSGPPEMIIKRTTGKSGEVSFGYVMDNYGEGRYRIEMLIPEGMEPADDIQEHTFNLSDNQPGFSFLFRIKSGQPQLESRRVPNFTIRYSDTLPESEPYSTQYLASVALLDINKEFPDYKAAEEAGDREMADTLLMGFIANAVTEYAHPDTPPEIQLMRASQLFARGIRNLRAGRKRRS